MRIPKQFALLTAGFACAAVTPTPAMHLNPTALAIRTAVRLNPTALAIRTVSHSPCTSSSLKSVAPAATNPAIGSLGAEPSADYCTGAPSSKSNGRLFVFLPGTGAVPNEYQDVLVAAENLGYHVIGLSYPNGATAGANLLAEELTLICGDKSASDLPCWTAVRANRFLGTPEPASTPHDPYEVKGSDDNAIQPRLESLLTYLGWSQYITAGGLPNYAKIVFGGHSQGGGEAAYIGSRVRTAGVLIFSSPDDGLMPSGGTATCQTGPTETTQAASWVNAKPATALSHFYGLVSCTDPGFTPVETVWAHLGGKMGLNAYGEPAAVASGRATPTSTHQFWSEFPTPAGSSGVLWQHDSTVLDSATPLCSGTSTPALLPVWDEMLIGAGGLSGPMQRSIC